MSYADQIEAQIAAYPETSSVHFPETLGDISLPAYPHVAVHPWGEDYCELQDAEWSCIARFRLVG